MDSQVIDKKVRVLCGAKETVGSLRVVYFTRRDKARRALKTATLCVLTAFVCLFIPGAHFILVPLTLISSPFLVVRSYRINTQIVGSEVACAECGGKVTRFTSQEVYPMYETCLLCKKENRLLLLEAQ